jgi:hypothetical protein
MKDFESLHQKVQEHINCSTTTDFITEMSTLEKETDTNEAALKWVALMTLHGINANAQKITVKKSADGEVVVTAKYNAETLPSPGDDAGAKIFETLRKITHIEAPKGKMPLALGVGDSSVDLAIKIKTKDGGEKLTIKFPEK